MSGDPAGPGGSALAAERRPTTWMDVIDDVLDAAVEGEDTVEATFEDMRVEVPLRYGEDAPHAEWRLDGTVRVHVEGLRGPLAEWLRWWSGQAESLERE